MIQKIFAGVSQNTKASGKDKHYRSPKEFVKLLKEIYNLSPNLIWTRAFLLSCNKQRETPPNSAITKS